MSPTAGTAAPSLTGARKAAVFIMGIGDQVSAEVLRHLSAEEVRRVSAEIAATNAVGSEQMLSVFREFESLTAEGRLFAQGGAECARRIVEQAFGPDSAQKLLVAPPAQAPLGEAGILQNVDPQQLAMHIRTEHPQTIAVVLSNLAPAAAAAVMDALPEELQPQVALRMASISRISTEAFQKVAEAIGTKLRSIRPLSKTDGVRALASLLNQVAPDRADSILSRLRQQNQAVEESVRALMFTFEDILSVDKEGMKVLIAKAERKTVTLALKGSSAKLRTHFTQCMSQRAAEMLVEDMEALGPVRIGDVKTAQNEIISLVQQLRQSGGLSVGSGENEYVV